MKPILLLARRAGLARRVFWIQGNLHKNLGEFLCIFTTCYFP